MAQTRDGARLTAAHRRAQIALAARGDVAARALWGRLDIGDLAGSEPAWMASMLAVGSDLHQQSATLATSYLSQYRDAEIGDGTLPTVSVAMPRTSAGVLHMAGPVRIRQQIARGERPQTAHASALTGFSGMFRREVMHGGRAMVMEVERGDPRAEGWRRVTDGSPCAFCAMLASRGPVYGSRQRGENIGGSALRYHGHCGCSAEIVYGEWQPNANEIAYIEAYEAAAAEADALGLPRTEANVLPRLRREWAR